MAERINAVKTSFFGKGAIRLLGPELQKMGIRRALLVTDRFLYDSGAAARVGQVLSDAGVEYAVYYNVQPNPTVQVVNDCIAAARTLQVQLLVALGGGSALFQHCHLMAVLLNVLRLAVTHQRPAGDEPHPGRIGKKVFHVMSSLPSGYRLLRL